MVRKFEKKQEKNNKQEKSISVPLLLVVRLYLKVKPAHSEESYTKKIQTKKILHFFWSC